MTKLKKILIVSASFVLVAALAVVGVLAATQQSLTVTSTISFEATGVKATAAVTRAVNNGTNIVSSIKRKVNNANETTTNTMTWNQDNNTTANDAVFNLGTLVFARNEGETAITFGTIEFDITITNLGGTTLSVGFVEPTIPATANINASYTYKKDGSAVTRTTMTGIGNTGFALITVVLSVKNPVKDVPSTQLTFAGTLTPSN